MAAFGHVRCNALSRPVKSTFVSRGGRNWHAELPGRETISKLCGSVQQIDCSDGQKGLDSRHKDRGYNGFVHTSVRSSADRRFMQKTHIILTHHHDL